MAQVTGGSDFDGVWEEWYPGGQPRLRVVYTAGVPRDDAAWWDEAGNPRLPLTTGEIVQIDLDAGLLSERERPPEPRLAWAFRPRETGPFGPPVEIRMDVRQRLLGPGAGIGRQLVAGETRLVVELRERRHRISLTDCPAMF